MCKRISIINRRKALLQLVLKSRSNQMKYKKYRTSEMAKSTKSKAIRYQLRVRLKTRKTTTLKLHSHLQCKSKMKGQSVAHKL